MRLEADEVPALLERRAARAQHVRLEDRRQLLEKIVDLARPDLQLQPLQVRPDVVDARAERVDVQERGDDACNGRLDVVTGVRTRARRGHRGEHDRSVVTVV